jgi:hypothetical protein
MTGVTTQAAGARRLGPLPLAAVRRGRGVSPLLVGAVATALATRIFFWAYTGRRFEDGLISITHSANAAAGLGLTHHPGEGHVHGFTSALSVLVPLLGELVHHGSGFVVIRVASLIAAAATIYFADRLARDLGLHLWARVFLLGYLAVDYLQIFYGMAGMETQMAVAILLWGATMIHERRLVGAGLALGLALLARPDFLLWIVAALGWLFLTSRKDPLERRRTLKIAGIAFAVVAPWLLFTTAYYGSPVPHTIVAKANAYESVPWGGGANAWWTFFTTHFSHTRQALASGLTPLKENYFADVQTFAKLPALIGILVVIGLWSLRGKGSLRPLVAFAVLFVGYLFFTDPPLYYHWYLPPLLAAIAVLAACGLDWCAGRSVPATAVLSAALVGVFAIQIPVFFPLDRTIQHKIEERVRQPLGMYLHRVVAPGQSVLSESAGYIGYYGHVKLFDFPGLTSPTVSNELARLPRTRRSLVDLIPALKPDWLVLRPSEAEAAQQVAGIGRRYRRVRVFSVSEQSSKLTSFGVRVADIDREFRVYRRIGVVPRAPVGVS